MGDNHLYSLSAAYDILGIVPGADDQAIKRAYRRLAKKYHPDVNKNDPEAEKCFKKIQWAYDLLNNGQDKNNDADRRPSDLHSGFSVPDDTHPFLYFYKALKRTGLLKNKS